MRFRVKVRDAKTGEMRVVEVEADSKEEARRLARLHVKTEQEEPEGEVVEGKVCSRCGASVGLQGGLMSNLCAQCSEADRQQTQAELAEAVRQRESAEAEVRRQREASEAEILRQAEAQRQARTVVSRRWQYKMVQIPPHIAVQEGSTTHGIAATYLERVVEEYAALGWEFHRVDEIGVIVNPGCLTALFGGRPELESTSW